MRRAIQCKIELFLQQSWMEFKSWEETRKNPETWPSFPPSSRELHTPLLVLAVSTNTMSQTLCMMPSQMLSQESYISVQEMRVNDSCEVLSTL